MCGDGGGLWTSRRDDTAWPPALRRLVFVESCMLVAGELENIITAVSDRERIAS